MKHDCLSEGQLENLLCAAPDPALLAHVAGCEDCAAKLAAFTLALPLLEPPAGLQNEVLRKTRTPQARQSESLGSYALRVFAAMAAVLALLFSGVFDKIASLPENLPRLTAQISAQLSTLNSQLSTQKEDIPNAPEPQ